jgi:predicted O-linked N-acetylglucosamine transferase (SPINDLY family)
MQLDPENSGGMNNLGACYLMLNRPAEAIAWLKKAAEANPHDPRARSNIGTALEDLRRFDEAIDAYRAAHAIDPNYTESLNNLAGVLAMLGRHREAEETYRESVRIQPTFAIAHSNLLLSMIQREDVSEQQVLAEHQDWARRHAPVVPVAPPKQNRQRLRIGYVSPDFREHSVRYFIAPILRHHDRSKVEVFCYSHTAKPDSVTQQLRAMADGWRDVYGMEDAALARQIREDQIDILVDLAGHTGEHRLLTFAQKPAPVQVTYLGYPATTGLPAIDYRLTDSITDPVGIESFCSEQLVRLPQSFFVFDGDDALPFDANLPARRNGFVTFGSINNFSKIGPSTLERWAVILHGTHPSRLVMINKAMGNHSTRETLLKFFGDHGVTADRLELLSPMGLAEYYRQISEMDITLDPLPFNGHTTTCQSLWMGVPVLTLAGNSFRGRMGKSVMTHLGLPEFVAESSEQYIARGISIASDLDRLAEIRRTLRERMRDSVLCDGKTFTAGLEEAYLRMMAL